MSPWENRRGGGDRPSEPIEPVELAELLRRRGRDDATWVALTADDASPASAALRGYVGERETAWATAAAMIERAAAHGQLLRTQWRVFDRLFALGETTSGGGAAVYRTAACWLCDVLLRLEREGGREDGD
jgi:hypothetical protein